MLTIIQASHADYERLPQMADLLAKCGPYPAHRAAILHTQDVPTQSVEEFIARIKPLFAGIDSAAIHTSSKGWPQGPNQSFQKTAQWAATQTLPWYNFELDNVPMQKGWLDALQKEYEEAKKPFMGVVVNTRGFIKDEEGKVIAVPTGEKHMVGTGIYPASYGRTSVKIPHLARHMMWAAGKMPEPYDVQLRHEVVPHAHPTNLIAHRFKTVNYRVEKGALTCDNHPDNPKTADHSAPVPQGTLVVHGVKDDSLAKWVLSGGVIPTPGVKTPEPTDPEPDLPPPVMDPVTAPPADKPSFLFFRIKQVLAESEKAWRWPKLAERLEMDPAVLKAEIEKPGSGLVIIAPGYVRLKTAS